MEGGVELGSHGGGGYWIEWWRNQEWRGEFFWDLDENFVVESFIYDEMAWSSYVSPPWLEYTTLTPSV
jgi:hypothetical protein